MKKAILFLALVVSIGSVFAQQEKAKGQGKGKGKEKNQNLTPEEKATKITNRLKTELSLTDEQVPKVNAVTLTRVKQATEAKTKTAEDKKAFGQQRKTIFQSWETEMKTILTPEQFATYQTKKDAQKKKMEEKKAADKAAGKPVKDLELDQDLIDE